LQSIPVLFTGEKANQLAPNGNIVSKSDAFRFHGAIHPITGRWGIGAAPNSSKKLRSKMIKGD